MKLLKDGCDKKEFLSQVKDSQKMAKMINDGVDEQEVYDAFSKNITKENKIELSKVIDSLKDRKHALQCQAEAVKEKNKIIEDKKKKKQRKMKEKNVAVYNNKTIKGNVSLYCLCISAEDRTPGLCKEFLTNLVRVRIRLLLHNFHEDVCSGLSGLS